jgi:hypothetical protein
MYLLIYLKYIKKYIAILNKYINLDVIIMRVTDSKSVHLKLNRHEKNR